MKSYIDSFSFHRRALLTTAIILTSGAAAVAQSSSSSSQSSSSAPGTGSSYQSDQSSSSGSNGSRSSSAVAGSTDTAASNQSSTSAHGSTSNQYGSSSQSGTSSTQKLSWSDRRFVTNVAEDNQKEIQLAQLGAQQASSPDVKRFAQMMVDDHTRMGQELQTFASSRQIELKADKDAKPDDRLAKQTGTEFDREFMKKMVSEHKKVVKNFQDRVEDSKDAELKQFAQAALPKLQHHLQMAQQLEQSIVPTGHTGTESWRSAAGSSDTSTTNAASDNSATSSTSGAASLPNGQATGSTGADRSSNTTNSSGQ